MAARQVRTHFVYVEEDPGLDEMEMMFGRDGRMLAEVPHISMTFEREGDHVFSSERARLRLFADVEQAAIRMALPPPRKSRSARDHPSRKALLPQHLPCDGP